MPGPARNEASQEEEIQIELPLMGAEERSSGYGSITPASTAALQEEETQTAALRNSLFAPPSIRFCSPERIRDCSTIGLNLFLGMSYCLLFLCLAATTIGLIILLYKFFKICDENPDLSICNIKMPVFP